MNWSTMRPVVCPKYGSSKISSALERVRSAVRSPRQGLNVAYRIQELPTEENVEIEVYTTTR